MRRAARAPTIVGIDFYPIGALSNLLTHHARQTVDVGFFRALWHVPFGCITFWTITSGRDNRTRGYLQARAGNDSLLDRLSQSHVGIPGPFGPQITQRGEAGHQRVAQVIGSTRNSKTESFFRDLIVPN